ncbi:DegT/DnrJ/EryC1/StrS family aminotransferase, partial [Verrucomicrobiota bacterium]
LKGLKGSIPAGALVVSIAVGAVPVIVDIDESLTIDPGSVEAAITPRTKAIIPVHMNGLVCDMDRIMALAEKHDLFVIEDACQCVGGYWTDGRRIGAIGDMGAYSFNFYKVISCGEGGMFVTNNREAHVRGLIYHDGGAYFREHADDLGMSIFCGINLRVSEISAAMMRVQLGRLEGIIADLRRVRGLILKAVGEPNGLSSIPYNGGLESGTGATIGYRFEDEESAECFAGALLEKKISTGIPINSGQHVYKNWEPVLSLNGSYCERTNAFQHPLNADHQPGYSRDMLPKTLDILRRTVLVPVNPDWTDDEASSAAAAIVEAV